MPITIFGILIGIAIMIFAIIGVSKEDPSKTYAGVYMYLNMHAFLIVAGGTVAATLVAHPFSHLIRGMLGFFVVFTRREFNWVKTVNDICEFSQVNATKGMQGLEEKINDYRSENLIKDGVGMIINGYKPEEVREFLEISVQRRYDREMIDFYIFRTMGRAAPAFGMVGTLVGLIYMLKAMGESPEKIGPFLAVALVATFYGLVMANLVFNPMGNKLQHQAESNMRIGNMEIEGIMYIIKKQHPVYIKDQLAGYLPMDQRRRLFEQEKREVKISVK